MNYFGTHGFVVCSRMCTTLRISKKPTMIREASKPDKYCKD